MNARGDIGKRANEVEKLVANAEFDRAFVRGIDFAKDFAHDQSFRHEAILHSASYKEVVRERRRGLPMEEFHRRRSESAMNLLQLLVDIVDSAAELEVL